ncbi:MAG: tRNA pseudouridine(38-40) synthase TruA, partial [Rickettsiales bacterium]|nr:tRNA pseudouridine(38-40) synthase TruA [Rickettsiales bacterium]
AGYAGWQAQDGLRSIAGALSDALFCLAGERRDFIAAGRTDAGVHAISMTAHAEIAKKIPLKNLLLGMNFWLSKNGDGIAVLRVRRAKQDFHARFSCVSREYVYRILNRAARPAILDGRAWWAPAPLDIKAMNLAAERLIGRHDFTSFRASGCQAKSPEKTLDFLKATRKGGVIEIRARARSFLYRQVRNMVGTLKLAGEGKLTPEDMERILRAKSRAAAGPAAPACGLYFVRAGY